MQNANAPLRRAAEELDQLLARRGHPVDVAADVDVRVEDGGPGRQAGAQLLLVLLGQAACPLQDLVHVGESTRSGYHRVPCPAVIIFGDTVRSPELRHEVPVTIPDPFVYVEQNGTRTAFVGSSRSRACRI